jgi:hypothetical protein
MSTTEKRARYLAKRHARREAAPYKHTRELWATVGPTTIGGPEDRCCFYKTQGEATASCGEHERVARVIVTTREIP